MTNPVLEQSSRRGPTLNLKARVGPPLSLQISVTKRESPSDAAPINFGKASAVLVTLSAIVGIGIWINGSFVGEKSASKPHASSKSAVSSGRANLVNRSLEAIAEIYISSVRDSNWGNDLLGNDTLQSGFKFPLIPSTTGECDYDIRVVYASGKNEERMKINLCREVEIVFEGR